jgi:LmbE family N-acetylglucosaminyl deacetylase
MSRKVLAIGAHPDDEVLGAGGTLAKHARNGDEVHVLIITEGTTTQYQSDDLIEDKEAAARRCGDRLGIKNVHFGRLPDMKLDTLAHTEVNDVVEEVVNEVEPNVVYTHSPHEVNRDHVEVFESTIVATRPQSGVEAVYAYETPSSTDWVGGATEQFTPDRYVDIQGHVDTKVEAFEQYEMERREYPHPRSKKAIRARATTRGTEAGFTAGEAFSVIVERAVEL